jgi:hypothetical protein
MADGGISPDRLQTARNVVSKLREEPAFRELIVANETGERPIVVASIDDPMRDLLRRIHAIGLPVTLCVQGGSASLTVATIRATEPHDNPDDSTPIHPEAPVGMFVAYVWMKGSVTMHLEEPAPAADFQLELV